MPFQSRSATLSGDTAYLFLIHQQKQVSTNSGSASSDDKDSSSQGSEKAETPFYEYKVVQRTVEIGPKQGGYVGVISGLKGRA